MPGSLYIFFLLLVILYYALEFKVISTTGKSFKVFISVAVASFVYEMFVILFGWTHIFTLIARDL